MPMFGIEPGSQPVVQLVVLISTSSVRLEDVVRIVVKNVSKYGASEQIVSGLH